MVKANESDRSPSQLAGRSGRDMASSSPVRLKDRKFELRDFELTTTLGRVLYLHLFVVGTVLVIKDLMKHT